MEENRDAGLDAAWAVLETLPRWLPEEVKPHVMDPNRRFAGRYLLVKAEQQVDRSALWKAWDVSRRAWAAVRILQPDAEPAELARFQREGKLASQFDCPGIPPLLGVGEDPIHGSYIAGGFVEGTPLSQVEKPMAADKAAGYVCQVGRIVQHLHTKGVIHRDLRPENMLLDGSGRVSFPHFAMARSVEGGTLTAANTKIGDPAFMAPEQLRGDKADPNTDTYQIGALLYYLLTGHAPFGPGKPFAVADEVLKNPPKPMREFVKDLPKDLEAICLKAMSKEKSARYGKPLDLVDDLQNFLNGKPTMARPRKGLLGGLFGK